MKSKRQQRFTAQKQKVAGYLLQFVMLFLAVFLGFVSENYREYRNGLKKEKAYIKSIINDLKADTTLLSENIKDFSVLNKCQDTVLMLFDKLDKGLNKKIINNIESFNGYPDFIYSDATIQQLKYSGAFRFISRQAAMDSILKYDAKVRTYMVYENALFEERSNIAKFTNKMFNKKDFIKQVIQLEKTVEQLEAEKFDYLITHDKAQIVELYNYLYEYFVVCYTIKTQKTQLKKEASNLIRFLQKEYKLDEE